MIPVGTAVGYLTLDYSEFSSNLKTAVGEATSMSGKFSDTLGSGLKTVGNQISSVGKTLTTGLTVPIGTAAAASVKFGAEFDKKMSEVQAVSNATSDEFNQMRDAAISWGEKTVYTATEAGDALYYMGLAGWEPEKSVNALGSVLNLAAAGNLELGRTSDIVTDGMTAMGYQAGELTNGIENTEYYANRLAAAMSNSNTDVNQMGEAMKYVGPLAGSLGYDISDLSVALGLMANAGVKGSQAGTGLRQALKYLITPANDAAAALMDDLGISLFDSSGKALEFRDVLTNLRETFSGTNVDIEEMSNILENEGEEALQNYVDSLDLTMSDQEKLTDIVQIFGTRALPGMLAIINSSDEDFNKLIGAIDGADEAFVQYGEEIMTMQEYNERLSKGLIDTSQSIEILGAAEGMARMQMDNLQGDWTKFTSALGTSKILITDLVKDSLRGFVQKLTELVQWFNNLDEEQKKHILKIAAIVAVIGPLLLALGKTITFIGNMITAFHNISQAITKIKAGFDMLGGVLGGISAPVLAVVAVIAILVAAFVHLWRTSDEFRENITSKFSELWNTLQGYFGQITDAINSLGFDFENIAQVIGAAWDWLCNMLAPIFEGIVTEVVTMIDGIVQQVTGIIQVISGIIGLIKGLIEGDGEQIQTSLDVLLQGIINLIEGAMKLVLAPVFGIFDVINSIFGTDLPTTFDEFKQVISDVVTAVGEFITGVIDWFAQLPEKIGEFFSNIWQHITDWATSVGEWFASIPEKVGNLVITVSEAISGFIDSIIEWFQQLPGKIAEFFASIWNNVTQWAANMVAKAKEMAQTFLNNVVSFFQRLPGKILQFITSAWNNVVNWATNMVNKAKEMAQTFLNNVVTFFTQLPGKILQFLTSAWNNTVKWASDMVNKAKEMATNFLNNVVNTLTSLPGKIKEKLDSALNNAKQWVKDMAAQGLQAAKDLISNFLEGAKNVGETVKSVGKAIVDGVWNGIKDAKDKFVENVKSFFSGIVDDVKDTLGIGSPSKVFAKEVGQWLPAGVAQGFEDALPAAINQMQGDLDKAVDRMDVPDVDVDGMGMTFESVVNQVADWFESIEERLSNVVDNVKADLAELIGVGQLVLNSDGTVSGLVYNKPSDSLQVNSPRVSQPGDSNGYGIGTINFYSNESIDEIQAAKLLRQTQRDLAEGFT